MRKDLFAVMEKGLKTFPFWELTFSLFKKVKFLSLGGDFESSLSKGLNVLAVLNPSRKKIEVFLARGRQERNSLLPGLLSKD
jgi:hypothetical protein